MSAYKIHGHKIIRYGQGIGIVKGRLMKSQIDRGLSNERMPLLRLLRTFCKNYWTRENVQYRRD